jgi:hypothetical protein
VELAVLQLEMIHHGLNAQLASPLQAQEAWRRE